MTRGYLTPRQRVIVNSLSPADRNALADTLEYALEKADPKLNPGGRIPEGSITNIYERLARTNPAAAAALDAMGQLATTPRFAPFTHKHSEASRLAEMGIPIEQGLTILAASDALDVQNELGASHRKTARDPERDWVKNPPNLREHLQMAAQIEEPGIEYGKYADKELADAGREANLPLRDHIRVMGDSLADSRGIDLDDDVVARGNGDLREDVERAIVTVLEPML